MRATYHKFVVTMKHIYCGAIKLWISVLLIGCEREQLAVIKSSSDKRYKKWPHPDRETLRLNSEKTSIWICKHPEIK